MSESGMAMQIEIADYILCPNKCAESSSSANDRPLYVKYLADAAVLLALAEKGAEPNTMKQKLSDHERLLSQTWLEGPEHEAIFKAFELVKSKLK